MQPFKPLPAITLLSVSTEAPTAIIHPALTNKPTDLRSRIIEEFLRARSLSINTRRAYKSDLKQFLGWTDRPLAEITHRQFGQYKEYLTKLTYLDAKGKTNKHNKSTINRALATVKSFFRWLNTTEQIERNPTVGISLEKLPLGEARDLSADQAAALRQALAQRGETQVRDTALLAVISHGLRASEVCGLNVGDYDGTRLRIRVAKADSTGTVPLCWEARIQLDAYLKLRQGQGETMAGAAPLFLSHSRNNTGERLTYQGLYYLIKQLGEAAGIANLHPHQFRHTFATALLLQGVDSLSAMTLTRHRSIASLERYAKRAKAAAAERAFYAAIGEEVPEPN